LRRLSNANPSRYPLTANPPRDKTRASNPFEAGFCRGGEEWIR
jgi:hypothetical protein